MKHGDECWLTCECFLERFIGFDVAGYDGKAEEGADKERRDLDHGEKRGASCAAVVYQQLLSDFCAYGPLVSLILLRQRQ